jgi:branched-chain amino acid transport system ATP-binding protein
MTSQHSPALEVSALFAGYGRFDVVRDIALTVGKGEAVALLGPNGAGKTTVLKAIMGLVKQRRGAIRVGGKDVSMLPPYLIARGLAAIAPEGRRLFLEQSVEDNLILGALHLRRDGRRVQALLASVYELFPVLFEYRWRLSSFLSGGEQQMVAIGRALMARPKLLCMDEPSMGLSPAYVEQVFDIIREINRQGTTIFMVEQNANMALQIADRAYVLQTGQVVLSGPAAELRQNEQIRHAYLGEMKVR